MQKRKRNASETCIHRTIKHIEVYVPKQSPFLFFLSHVSTDFVHSYKSMVAINDRDPISISLKQHFKSTYKRRCNTGASSCNISRANMEHEGQATENQPILKCRSRIKLTLDRECVRNAWKASMWNHMEDHRKL